MLRDLLTQKCVDKNKLLILDTPEHVDSENIKLKIGPRSLLDQLFSKRDFYLPKTVFVLRMSLNVFHDLKNVKMATISLKICQFWPILTNFSYIL
jgi:hypothetical protein